MADASRSQEQQHTHKGRTDTPKPHAPRAPDSQAQQQDLREALARGSSTVAAGTSSIKRAEMKATAGRAGERNLTVEWIAVQVGPSLSCRFDVATAAGHRLEVVLEQLAYHKTYTGNGIVRTLPVPVAPAGTALQLTARDTDTGETLEAKGVWYLMGGSGLLARLWQAVKRALWKPGEAA
jgi:hypothetical protein